MPGFNLRRTLVIAVSVSLIAFSLAACGGGEAKPTLQATPLPRGASLIVNPTAVEPGGNIEVLGAGFLPEEALSIELVGALQDGNITLATGVMANSSGAFTTVAPVSPNSSTGVFTLRVSGSRGSLVTMPLVIVKVSK
jgi:hypothetical protein